MFSDQIIIKICVCDYSNVCMPAYKVVKPLLSIVYNNYM